ncbi:MAG: hypothetical protein HOW73_24430 [Polyangiaceae bacterium]|nr:hypothetical protein [Polyangiaceae bacterium]
MLNLPEGALTSEVALVNADATDVCFDVKMRTWQGASPEWLVDLTVDDASVAESEVFLRPCTSQSIGPADRVPMTLSCLPVDTAVGSSVTDAGDSIQVRGDRVCLSHGGQLGERSETVKLSLKQGALGYAFVWHFAGHASN